MKTRWLIPTATVLLAICYTATAHAITWTCSSNTSWNLNQPDADFAAGKYPTWADCEAWRNGDPGPGYVWSYGPSVAVTTTSTTTTVPPTTTTTTPETTTTEAATTTTTTVPETSTTQSLPEPTSQATTSTQTTQATTSTSVPVTTTTHQTPNTTTSTSSSSTLPTASSTTDLPSTTTSPDSTLPVVDSIPPTVNQNTVVRVHGVKPRRGFGKGTTPATPIVTTVTVLLTSPISPLSIARRKDK